MVLFGELKMVKQQENKAHPAVGVRITCCKIKHSVQS